MAIPIALAAISLFAAAISAGFIGAVSVASRKEGNNHTLTSQATGHVTRVARQLNGVHVLRSAAHHPVPLEYSIG